LGKLIHANDKTTVGMILASVSANNEKNSWHDSCYGKQKKGEHFAPLLFVFVHIVHTAQKNTFLLSILPIAFCIHIVYNNIVGRGQEVAP